MSTILTFLYSLILPIQISGFELSCPRTLTQKEAELTVNAESNASRVRVKHFTTEPRINSATHTCIYMRTCNSYTAFYEGGGSFLTNSAEKKGNKGSKSHICTVF